MRLTLQRTRTELRDLVETVLVPGLAAVMPWPWCFAIFKQLSRCSFFYRAACTRALAEAQARGWVVGDAEAWLQVRRLITMVDHADHYLVRTRSDAWLKRYMQVQGEWPAPGQAALCLSFHWGAGMWGLRHLHRAGLNGNALMGNLNREDFPGRTVFYHYIKARKQSVERALGRPHINVAASLRPMLKALRKKEQVVAVVDVPADQVSASQSITIVGLRARVPTALFRLAVEQRIPVTVYLTGLRVSDGQRFLRIRQLGVRQDIDSLLEEVFRDLESAIIEDPAAWHFWSEAGRFFEK